MEKNYSKYGYMYIAPFFIVLLVFSLYPIVYSMYLSFTDYNGIGAPNWVGFKNYQLVLKNKDIYLAIWSTIRIWGVNIILQVGTAFALVMIFSDLKYRFKGLNFFRIVFYLPNLIAATSVALIFVKLLDKNYGVINTLLFEMNLINSPIPWLDKPLLAQLSVSGIQTWMWFGNSFILFMAAIQAVNKEAIEAAVIDGANRFQILSKIKLPLIKPILVYVGITSLIGGLQLFEVPYLLTDKRGAPAKSLQTVIVYLFKFYDVQRYGIAAAIAFILFVFVLVVSMMFLLVVNFDKVKAYSEKVRAERLEREAEVK